MPSIAEGLSLNTPFHLENRVNTTMEPEMDTAIVPE
jgi:hypothetical protein